MCGRYSLAQDAHELTERFAVPAPAPRIARRYNIAPSQDAPVVLDEGGARRLGLLRWGLIPSWAEEPSIGHELINARAETILEKPSFETPFRRRRCLVPADGFYEWRRRARGKKTPMRIVVQGGQPFAMAGLWDAWQDAEGKEVRSFTIITTAAAAAVSPIHDRMPVILDKAGEEAWLDPKAETRDLLALLRPREEGLSAFEVSSAVNSPAVDAPACLEPALVLF